MIRQLQAELSRRRTADLTAEQRARLAIECRGSFLRFCEHALAQEGLKPAKHHRLLIQTLQDVADGVTERQMIFMPPGSAKSKYTSELFPAWYMARFPGEPVIGASNNAKLAMRFSSRVQRYIRRFGDVLGIDLASEAKERWETTAGGEYLAVGVGGALPGYRAKLFICDDPYPGRKEADSETYRDTVSEWWDGDVGPRLKPDAAWVLMHTRYHEDDQAGRLLLVEPTKWRVLTLPAIADSTDDPLGRSIGEPIWDDDPAYPYGAMMLAKQAELANKGATREWSSQYQQAPRPAEGALFKVDRIDVIDWPAHFRGWQIGRGWDLAATRQIGSADPDWTVGIKLARTAEGRYVILDVARARGNPEEVETLILGTTKQDGHGVKVSIPQDPGQAGKTQVLAYTRALAGYPVSSSTETGDKATRAAPVIAQVNGGNLAVARGPGGEVPWWWPALREELRAFPVGTKDDQVDALSRAFGIVGLNAAPIVFSAETMAMLQRRR